MILGVPILKHFRVALQYKKKRNLLILNLLLLQLLTDFNEII